MGLVLVLVLVPDLRGGLRYRGIAPRPHSRHSHNHLAGRGGSITDEAIRWIAREGVALYLMCLSGEAFTVIGETMETDHRRRA